jgi:hypothetical protein
MFRSHFAHNGNITQLHWVVIIFPASMFTLLLLMELDHFLELLYSAIGTVAPPFSVSSVTMDVITSQSLPGSPSPSASKKRKLSDGSVAAILENPTDSEIEGTGQVTSTSAIESLVQYVTDGLAQWAGGKGKAATIASAILKLINAYASVSGHLSSLTD